MADFYTLSQLPTFQPDRFQRSSSEASGASGAAFPHVKRVDLTTSRTSLAAGTTLQLTWVATGDDGSDITELVPPSALRFLSSDESKLIVDADGVALGIAAGSVTISATVGDYAPTESGASQAFTISAALASANLLADWSPSTRGTDVISDLSGNNRTGIGGSGAGTDVYDPSFNPNGPAMVFTGGKYAQAPIVLTTGLAVHAVARATAPASAQQFTICSDTGSDTQASLQIDVSAAHIQFLFVDNTGTPFTLTYTTVIDLAHYYDVLAQYDTSKGGELWVDGVLRASCPPGAPLRTSWTDHTSAAHMIFGGVVHLGTSTTPVSTDPGCIVGRMRVYSACIADDVRRANSALFASIDYNGVHGTSEMPAMGALTVDVITDIGAHFNWTEPASVAGDVTELWVKDPYQGTAWFLWWEEAEVGGSKVHETFGLLPGTAYQAAVRARRATLSGGTIYSAGAASDDPATWPSTTRASFTTTGTARGTVVGTDFPHDVVALTVLTNTPGTLNLQGTLGDSFVSGDTIALWWRNMDNKASTWQGPIDATASVGSVDASDHTHFSHLFSNTLPQGTNIVFAARSKRHGYYPPVSSEDWPASWASSAQLAVFTAVLVGVPPLVPPPTVLQNDSGILTLRVTLPPGVVPGDTLDVEWAKNGLAVFTRKATNAVTSGVAGSFKDYSWTPPDAAANDVLEVAARIARPAGGGVYSYHPNASTPHMGLNTTGTDAPGWSPFPHLQVTIPAGLAQTFIVGGTICPTITSVASTPSLPTLTLNSELDVRFQMTIPYDVGGNDFSEVWTRTNDGAGTVGAWSRVGYALYPYLPNGTFDFPSISAFALGSTRYEVAFRTARWTTVTPTYSSGATDTAHPENWPTRLFFTTASFTNAGPGLPVDPWLRGIWVYGTNTYILRWTFMVQPDWVSAGSNNDGFRGWWKKPSMTDWSSDVVLNFTSTFIPGVRFGIGSSGLTEYGVHSGAFQLYKNVGSATLYDPAQAPPLTPTDFPPATVMSVALANPVTFISPPPDFSPPSVITPTMSAAGKPSLSIVVTHPSGSTDTRDAFEWWAKAPGGAWGLLKTSAVQSVGSPITIATATSGFTDLQESDGGLYLFNWRYLRDGNAATPRADNLTLYNPNANISDGSGQLPNRWYPDYVSALFHRSPPVFPAFSVTNSYSDGFEFTFTNPVVDSALTDAYAVESSVLAGLDSVEVWATTGGGAWVKMYTTAPLTGATISLSGHTHAVRVGGFASGTTYDVALRYFRSGGDPRPNYISTQRDATNPAAWPSQTRASGVSTT